MRMHTDDNSNRLRFAVPVALFSGSSMAMMFPDHTLPNSALLRVFVFLLSNESFTRLPLLCTQQYETSGVSMNARKSLGSWGKASKGTLTATLLMPK